MGTKPSALIPKTIGSGESFVSSLCSELLEQNVRKHPTYDTKPVNTWAADDILDWLLAESEKLGVDCTQLRAENFTCLTGADLVELTEGEFEQKVPSLGQSLFFSMRLMSIADDVCLRPNQYKHDSTLRLKPINSWSNDDVYEWHFEPSEKLHVDFTQFRGENVSQITCADLLSMTEEAFERISPKRGVPLHASVHMPNDSLLHENFTSDEYNGIPRWDENSPNKDGTPSVEPKEEDPNSSQVVIRKRGRPKNPNRQNKKKAESFGRPWIFLLNLLKNPKTCPSLIRWENYDTGTFRFTNSVKVAELWGKRTGNKDMNFGKFSRAMRYHYIRGYLKSESPRLVYSFGPAFTNWKVEDPNFVRARQVASRVGG